MNRNDQGLLAFAFGAVALCMALGGQALAEERERLGAQAARKALLGFEVSGVRTPNNEPWSECIDPTGATSFLVNGQIRLGRVTFEADKRICFAYAEDGFRRQHCFFAERVNGALRLVDADGGPMIYRVMRAAPVTACGANQAIG